MRQSSLEGSEVKQCWLWKLVLVCTNNKSLDKSHNLSNLSIFSSIKLVHGNDNAHLYSFPRTQMANLIHRHWGGSSVPDTLGHDLKVVGHEWRWRKGFDTKSYLLLWPDLGLPVSVCAFHFQAKVNHICKSLRSHFLLGVISNLTSLRHQFGWLTWTLALKWRSKMDWE